MRTPGVLAAILFPAAALAAPATSRLRRPPLFRPYADYKITDCKVTEYDSVRFLKMKQPERTEEGKVTYLFYQRPRTGARRSRSCATYQNALARIGRTIVDIDDRHFVYGKVVQDGREIWAQAEARRRHDRLYVVEKKEMAQHIVRTPPRSRTT